MGQNMVKNWIGGQWVEARASSSENVVNPASGEVLGVVPHSSGDDVDAAVQAARKAFEAWRQIPVPRRARMLFRYQQLLVDHQDELAHLITQENGKTLDDARGEVQRGIENVEFAAGIPSLMMGSQLPDIATGLESGVYRYPIGVVAAITPFNFPMMVPTWMFPMAIACGNAVVLKPSERTPLTVNRLAALCQEAGIPDGVLNVVHGAHEVVNALLTHPDIAAVSFVGSQRVAEHVYTTAAAHHKRVQALGGAKNHTIVLPDAPLELAADQIIKSAFGSAGERCMATSVVVLVDPLGDDFVARLRALADQLVLGPGERPEVTLGPVIRPEHRDRIDTYIASGSRSGAQLVRDGRQDALPSSGYFLGPTLFDHVTDAMDIWQDEIFGPVLSIRRAASLEDAIAIANGSSYANGACLFTQNVHAVRVFRETIDAGMLGINIGVPAPMAFFPFSGWKNSFYGDLHANGHDAVEFYTRKKVVTARY